MLLNDCFLAPDGMVTLDQALAFLEGRVEPVVGTEIVPTASCSGRMLAKPVIAPITQPPFANSAMDGFAFRAADLGGSSEGEMKVSARVAAGHPFLGQVGQGQAARIFTGAPMPAGLDTVAMQEDCTAFERDGQEWVRLPRGLDPGNYVRPAGEDFQAGGIVLGAGKRLRPQDLAIAAAAGQPSLTVYRRLRVAVFSTGDELIAPGLPLPPGAIYDGSRFGLMALAEGLGCVVTDLGNLPDNLDVTAAALAEAARSHDLLLTAGGVSVGGEDHVRAAVEKNGSINLWRMAIKPGKPTALGTCNGAAFVGLPGNPVSAQVMFMIFARPVILLLAGATAEPASPARFRVPAGFTLKKDHPRREFFRARLEPDGNGEMRAFLHDRQDSNIISSLVESDGLVDIREGKCDVAPGGMVDYIPYATLR